MTARTLTVVLMVTITAVSTEKCQKLDPVLWDYTFCPHPDSKAWIQLEIKMDCDKDRDYHCASNSQGCDVQLCVKKVYCEAGHRPLLDPDKDTAICAPCPPDRYQTTGFWSNQRSYCEHEKTKCDGIGQIECQPGSTTTDRSCRCNIHQNLALQDYALHNETCCTINDPWCECIQFKSPCLNGTVRHDNYKCLKECPPNSFRPWDSETCYPNSTTVTVERTTGTVKNITVFFSTTVTVERTTADQTPASGSTGLPDTVNVGLIVGFILGGLVLAGLMVGLWVCYRRKKWKTVLAGLMVGLWVCCRRKKWKTDLPKDEEQAVPLQDQISGEGRPGETTSNGHIVGRESVDMANGHRVHVEDYRKCRYASSVLEEEDTERKYLLQSPGAEAGSSTKGIGKDLRENTISNKGERIGNESVQALVHPLGKEIKGGQEEEATEKDHLLQSEAGSSTKVIVKNLYRDCVINIRQTKTNIHDGRGNTFNLGKNNKTKTTLTENPVAGNEDIVMFESIKSTSERTSSVEENPDNQLNSHSHDNQWNSHSHDNQWNSHSHDNQPQPEIKEESTGSLFKDAESEHRPVEHEEQVMTELKLHTDISRIGSSSEETAVKLTGSDPHESMEEVRTEEMCKPIQDDDNCSNDETKKKDFF